MVCLIKTCIFSTACCLNTQCGNASPGNLWALPDSQQDGLSVNENCPTGKTENEQNENSPLEIYSHLLKVATSEGLLKKKGHNPSVNRDEMKMKLKKSGVQDKSWEIYIRGIVIPEIWAYHRQTPNQSQLKCLWHLWPMARQSALSRQADIKKKRHANCVYVRKKAREPTAVANATPASSVFPRWPQKIMLTKPIRKDINWAMY